jgi:hypothetical protein
MQRFLSLKTIPKLFNNNFKIWYIRIKNTSTPTTGSPTVTLFQLRSNYHTGLEPQTTLVLILLIFYSSY